MYFFEYYQLNQHFTRDDLGYDIGYRMLHCLKIINNTRLFQKKILNYNIYINLSLYSLDCLHLYYMFIYLFTYLFIYLFRGKFFLTELQLVSTVIHFFLLLTRIFLFIPSITIYIITITILHKIFIFIFTCTVLFLSFASSVFMLFLTFLLLGICFFFLPSQFFNL